MVNQPECFLYPKTLTHLDSFCLWYKYFIVVDEGYVSLWFFFVFFYNQGINLDLRMSVLNLGQN